MNQFSQNYRQEALLNEIDKEVQDVNNKNQIKVIGRTGRFAQIQQEGSFLGPGQSNILPEGGYDKKLSMSVKPQKNAKLQSLDLRVNKPQPLDVQ